jgi:hypothetical protein
LAFALQEHFTTQDVPKLRAAALKNINGVFHGTVRGERWWLASKGAINTQKTEIVTEEHETAISGITSDDDMVWYVGQPDKEVVGVIVFRIEVDLSIGKLAKNLDMSLMPGLPDSLREIVSSLSGIPKEKGPIGRTGGSLLLDSSPRPSAGLRLVVVEPKLDIEVERGRSPRITRQALSNLKSYLESQRRCSKTRRWASVIGTLAHVGLGCLLTILGWFGPWTASVLVGGVMLFSVNSLMNASGPEDTSIVP